MEAFTTEAINLSMRDIDTGRPLQANVYHVPGIRNVDGSLRDLSIGQLVMAICLSRASELEAEIIGKMVEISSVTVKLESMTTIQEKFVNEQSTSWTGDVSFLWNDGTGEKMLTYSNAGDLIAFLRKSEDQGGLGLDKAIPATGATCNEVVSALSSKMDSLNSMNQTDMIKLQSTTSKRDQTYDLITNMLKSLHTVLCGIANNT